MNTTVYILYGRYGEGKSWFLRHVTCQIISIFQVRRKTWWQGRTGDFIVECHIEQLSSLIKALEENAYIRNLVLIKMELSIVKVIEV